MPLKRKVRNLPNMNDDDKVNQMSFFDPVYNDGVEMSDSDEESEDELLADGVPRFAFRERNKNNDESNETLDAVPISAAPVRVEKNDTIDQDQSGDISTTKIMARIREIQNSLQQARTMLEPMEKFKDLIPGSAEQCTKLRSIISNLEEQQAGYVNLLNLIALTAEERTAIVNKYTAPRQMQMNAREHTNNVDDDDDDEEDEDDDDDDRLSPRRDDELPVRPRIESKIGFTPNPVVPVTPTVPATINSDNEQTNRNDNSNYDSLVGSLKSDTINWKDQQSTSEDETSDVDSEPDEKEIVRNLMLQKEQLRALQGQKRALLALQRRSEQRLLEQQQRQQSETKKINSPAQEREKENQLETTGSNANVPKLSENAMLSDINALRDRLKLLRNLYEQKHHAEMQQINNQSSKNRPMTKKLPTCENRLKNLQNVRERLDELEQIVTFYQSELMEPSEEETIAYEEAPIPSVDVHRLKTLMMQRASSQGTTTTNNNENPPKQLDKLSDELAAKRRELEQAKSALSHLQQMVKRIQPDECSSSSSTPVHPVSSSTKANNNTFEQHTDQTSTAARKPSLLSSILSPKPPSVPAQNSSYADAKMAAQHREIERLVESRQRLHTIKDQIASLHQSMATPPAISAPTPPDRVDRPKKDVEMRPNNSALQTPPPLVATRKITGTYTDKLNDSQNLRPPHPFNRPEIFSDDDDEELGRFECESGDGEEIDDDNGSEVDLRSSSRRSNSILSDQPMHSRMKQSNFHAPEDIVAEHERRLLQTNLNPDSTTEISAQMRQVCHCLSTFIREQKSFNRHIEQHLMAATSAAAPPPPPPPPSQSITVADPVFSQLQQQVLTQGLIVNLNTAYREIAVLQSEINALQSENTRLTSSVTLDSQYQNMPRLVSRDASKESLYSWGQIKSVRQQKQQQSSSRFDDEQQQHLLSTSTKFDNGSKTSFNSQSTGKQTAIHVNRNGLETTPTRHESKSFHFRSNPISDSYDMTNLNHHRRSSKDNISKSFIIRRRPLSTTDDQNDVIKSQTVDYDHQRHFEQETTQSIDDYRQTSVQQRQIFNENSEEEDDDDEEQSNDLPTSIFNIQPLACYSSQSHDLNNIDVQTLDLQVKSIMVQLIPFMRLHINELFDQSILNHIRERIVFLFKQQPDSAQLIRNFQNQFSELLGKTIGKYCGTTIRECAVDLIRDISDVSFDELVKYKVFENAANAPSTTSRDMDDQQITSIVPPVLTKQQDDYSPRFDTIVRHYVQQTSSSNDDGENENKYQIELAESESRPLMLIGSDEEDNDSDQEENKDSELETAVSRQQQQQTNLNSNEIQGNGTTTSTELNSNGHEYILINQANKYQMIVPEMIQENDENKTFASSSSSTP